MKYAFFDGDKVGNSIRNLLLADKHGEATLLSESIKRAIQRIEEAVASHTDARLILAGGDDVLLAYEAEEAIVNLIPEIFTRETGLSMSVGVGETVSDSLRSLNSSKINNLMKSMLPALEGKVSVQAMKPLEVSLIVFADSFSPDPYINVIQHWLSRKKVRQIILISIERDIGKRISSESKLKSLKSRIFDQVQLLSNSKYLRKKEDSRDDWEEITVSLEESERNLYSAMFDQLSSTAFTFYSSGYLELGGFLSRIITESKAIETQPVFDISTVKKEFIVDIFSILCSEGERDINTFQLTLPPTYSEKDLIHELRCDQTYSYVPIASSNYTADKIVTSQKKSTNLQDYERRCVALANELEASMNFSIQLKNMVAEEFSRFLMTAIFFTFVLPIGVLIGYLALKGWDTFEKYTFIVPVVIYFVVSYLVASIFGSKFSINPISLKENFKAWKLRDLSKKE